MYLLQAKNLIVRLLEVLEFDNREKIREHNTEKNKNENIITTIINTDCEQQCVLQGLTQ